MTAETESGGRMIRSGAEESAPALRHHRFEELSPAELLGICEVIHEAFPDPERKAAERLDGFLAPPPDPTREAFVFWAGGEAVATALIFRREILTPAGALVVQALAGACCRLSRRGEGWGRRVVEAAFAEVDRGRFPVALFQTSVPHFYEKLGARRVDNPFINSRFTPDAHDLRRGTSDERPWWEPHVMIYPAGFNWPEGTIDLQGRGY